MDELKGSRRRRVSNPSEDLMIAEQRAQRAQINSML
jgi:hypothetical protein